MKLQDVYEDWLEEVEIEDSEELKEGMIFFYELGMESPKLPCSIFEVGILDYNPHNDTQHIKYFYDETEAHRYHDHLEKNFRYNPHDHRTQHKRLFIKTHEIYT